MDNVNLKKPIRLLKIGLVVTEGNSILLCKPFAFPDLILPGGRLEENESHLQCLIREIKEELGEDADLDIQTLEYVGIFSDRAAGKTDRTVDIVLYTGKLAGDLKASSEIKELVWLSPSSDSHLLSPIIKNKILPYLISLGMLQEDAQR